MQLSLRAATCTGSWWRCVTLLMTSKNHLHKVAGRFHVTFGDEVCEAAETQTTSLTD